MTTANRITRGFIRLGVAAAVLLGLCGVGVTFLATADAYRRAHFDPTTIVDGIVDGQAPPCRTGAEVCDPWERAWPAPPPKGIVVGQAGHVEFELPPAAWLVAVEKASYGLGVTAILAFAVFGFFRGLAWVIVGFVRD